MVTEIKFSYSIFYVLRGAHARADFQGLSVLRTVLLLECLH